MPPRSRMIGAVDRKEGELSAEEAALAKKFFVAFGFIITAAVIVGIESFVDLPYVLFGVILVGVAVVLKINSADGKHPNKLIAKTE